jgi:hypothetical protein
VTIDAVYTWANFLDPAWREARDHFAALDPAKRVKPDPANAAAIRHTDNGELRYSLRSLERYAPFVRRVHLVIDGSPPDWLDAGAHDVRVWSSRDIFPAGFPLPVFSSDLIEAFLWKIPDLSEHYIYFNDDMLLASPCKPDDFFDAHGRSIVRMVPDLIDAPLGPVDFVYSRMLRNTERAIRRHIRPIYRPRFPTSKPWVPMIARRLIQKKLALNEMAHIAQPFHRSLWPLFHEVFAKELAALSTSRFRHVQGFCVNLAYQYLAHQRQQAAFTFDASDLLIPRRAAPEELRALQQDARDAARKGIKFLCFNDGIGHSEIDWPTFIDETLRGILDKPSRWEKGTQSSTRVS